MCHVYGDINRHGLCLVYVNVWPGSKLMYVAILLHLGLVIQRRKRMGVAALKVQNEYCKSVLHKNRAKLWVAEIVPPLQMTLTVSLLQVVLIKTYFNNGGHT